MTEAPNQKPPLRVEALDPSSDKAAAFIFLHGYGDDAEGWINIAHQFQAASKLPHLNWIFPNAPHNQEAMSTAWYTPSSFSPIPVGRSSSEATEREAQNLDKEFEEEYEDEIWNSVEYVEGLIEKEIERGVPVEKIVVGGFSQGCAIALVTGLAGKFRGRLGAVVALSGYLPRGKRVYEGRERFKEESAGKEEERMRVFMAHGTRDVLVPMRVFRDSKARVEKTAGEGRVDAHVYEGLGHVTSGTELRDMCGFLESVVPA